MQRGTAGMMNVVYLSPSYFDTTSIVGDGIAVGSNIALDRILAGSSLPRAKDGEV